jgi:hypothetical protein
MQVVSFNPGLFTLGTDWAGGWVCPNATQNMTVWGGGTIRNGNLFSWRYNPLGCIFHNPLADFSLILEVS